MKRFKTKFYWKLCLWPIKLDKSYIAKNKPMTNSWILFSKLNMQQFINRIVPRNWINNFSQIQSASFEINNISLQCSRVFFPCNDFFQIFLSYEENKIFLHHKRKNYRLLNWFLDIVISGILLYVLSGSIFLDKK